MDRKKERDNMQKGRQMKRERERLKSLERKIEGQRKRVKIGQRVLERKKESEFHK